MIKPFLMIALLAVASCATPSKGPKKPNESHRVPINRTPPPELMPEPLTANQGSARK